MTNQINPMAYQQTRPIGNINPNYFGNQVTSQAYPQNINGWGNAGYSNQMQPSNEQPNNNIIWVQGEGGAKSYIVPNNTSLALWDSESQTIYIKSVDATGRPTMTILDYVDRNAPEEKQNTMPVDYVTQDQFNQLSNKLSRQMEDFQNDLQKKFNDFKSRTNNINKKVKS